MWERARVRAPAMRVVLPEVRRAVGVVLERRLRRLRRIRSSIWRKGRYLLASLGVVVLVWVSSRASEPFAVVVPLGSEAADMWVGYNHAVLLQ